MTVSGYLAELTSYLPFLPSAVLCYCPMKHQLKLKKTQIFLCIFIFFITLIPIAAYLKCRFSLSDNFFTFPMLILFFLFFQFSVCANFSQSLAVFVFVCALLSFSSNFTNGYDAARYPDSAVFISRVDTSLFHFGVSLLMLLLLTLPLMQYGSFLIDSLSSPKVWYMTVLISGTFLGVNILVIPQRHETLYLNRMFFIFWCVLGILLSLMLMIYVLFYFVAVALLDSAKVSERNHFLEMQEAQYLKQTKYMEETARVRHDFRHTLHTLKMLADEKEYDSLNQYLKKYINALPVSHVITYCQNNSVNALLNYLIPIARESAVDIRIYINIPEHLPVTDIDLCSILGNVLENAIDGCKTVSSEKRSVQLSVTTRHDSYLYIVSTNTFDGIVKKEKNQYQTTRKNGHGIGLSSIQLTVEKYNGTVQFSNDDSRFYVDIMIPI